MKTETIIHHNSLALPASTWSALNLNLPNQKKVGAGQGPDRGDSIGAVKSAYLDHNPLFDAKRVAGPVSETGLAKPMQTGDLPPASGPISQGFPNNASSSAVKDFPLDNLQPDNMKPSPPPFPPVRTSLDHPSSFPLLASVKTTASPAWTHLPNDYQDPWKLPDNLPQFAILQPDWIELSPYGDFPHPRGLQRVDRIAAEKIVNKFNSFWSKLGRKFAGIPVYIGHPDVPELQNEYPDRKAYGWIAELQARAEGLYCRVKWSEAARNLIANAHYKFYSPFWEAEPIGNQNGKTIYRPVALLSVGLTNTPNIPVQPLANSHTSPTLESVSSAPSAVNPSLFPNSALSAQHSALPTNSVLSPQSSELGISQSSLHPSPHAHPSQPDNLKPDNMKPIPTPFPQLPPVKTSENHSALSPQHSALSLPLANEVLALQTLLFQRDERIQALQQHMANARADWQSQSLRMEEEIGTLRRAIDRLEQSRIDIALDHALVQGRIAPAEREFWNTQLRQDFETRHHELKGRAPVVHMDSLTMNLHQNGLGNAAAPSVDLANGEKRNRILKELISAKQKFGMTYTEAWAAVKEERPDIFAAMERRA